MRRYRGQLQLSVLVIGVLLLSAIRGAWAMETIPWHLTLPPSADGSHTGRILMTPEAHFHEGPGKTGVKGAVYHVHFRDPKTGGLGPAIPLDKDGNSLQTEVESKTSDDAPDHELAMIDRRTEAALLAGNWQMVANALAAQPEPLVSAIEPLLLGHAYLALNRNNESFLLLWTSQHPMQRQVWERWAADLVRRYPANAVALYLHGDALARLQQWDAAIARFTESIQRQPKFALALNARGTIYAVQGFYNEAIPDLAVAIKTSPRLVDGHLSLGTLWLRRRAHDGAQEAFQQALKLSPNGALGINGRASVAYALCRWEQASQGFSEASRLHTLPFILANLHRVGVAAEQARLPGQDRSPLLRLSDFLDWHALRLATTREDDLLRKILSGPWPEVIDQGVIEKLNQALDDPQFYERNKGLMNLSSAPDELLALLESTVVPRHKRSAELTNAELEQIRRVNRRLLEWAYSGLIAQYDQRNPGMQVTMKSGLVNPWSYGDQVQWKQGLSTGHLQTALGRMYLQKPVADATASLGVAVSTRMPQIGGPIAAIGMAYKSALDIGIESSRTTLQSRGPLSPSVNPSGVSTDMRQACTDRGDWQVEAPFGIAYPAAATVADNPSQGGGK